MTGDPPVLDRPALRAALSAMQIQPPEPGTRFEDALAALQGWNIGFAERVTEEYRRFLYLAATAGFEVTPSQCVDEAWHLHLALPHYDEVLCDRILGRPLGHRPGTGTPEDQARCERQYEETLDLYQRVFDEPAPGDIWPRPVAAEESEDPWLHLNGRPLGLAFAGFSLFAALAAYFIGAPLVGNLLVGAGIFLGLVSFPFEDPLGLGRRRRRKGGGGGGDCGGGFGDCGASCGGGCGGGD